MFLAPAQVRKPVQGALHVFPEPTAEIPHCCSGGFMRLLRRSCSVGTSWTELSKGAHAHQVAGRLGQHKHPFHTLRPRTVTWRMLSTVFAQPKPCSINLHLRCEMA